MDKKGWLKVSEDVKPWEGHIGDVIVDFDNTITGDEDAYPEMGIPRKGVSEALKKIKKKGFKIRINTCRLNYHAWEELGSDGYKEEIARIIEFLIENKIPFDDFVLWYEGKPFGHAYIDDKAIEVDSWDNILKKVLDRPVK